MIKPLAPILPQKTVMRRISHGIDVRTLGRQGVSLEEMINGIKNHLHISDEEIQKKVKITEMSYDTLCGYEIDVFFDVVEEVENESYNIQMAQYSIDLESYTENMKYYEQFISISEQRRLLERIRLAKMEVKKLENQLKSL